ncbi:hypothetical protein AB0M19_10645 [Streptomyces sp. NPDC051920]|uniref:hypothetical protein n=1 Tax=Streptomyces sp. NPDC051920 TaxID=3155523 RepID=UPI00343C6991
MTAALACLALGGVMAGCAADSAAKEISADQLLDDANETMRALKSVTIDTATKVTKGDDRSSRMTTGFKGVCAVRTTWASGARLEQLRINGSDYVRPNRTYIEASGQDMGGTDEQGRWIKVPASESTPGDGLSDCTYKFSSFGEVTKGQPTTVNRTPAIMLKVTDKEYKDTSFTFYVATEGKPYILKVVAEDDQFDSTTSFSAFDEPLNVQAPDKGDVLDTNGAD